MSGIGHYPQAADDPCFAPGESIALVVEPDNPHDSLAVGVWNADRTLKVGRAPAASRALRRTIASHRVVRPCATSANTPLDEDLASGLTNVRPIR